MNLRKLSELSCLELMDFFFSFFFVENWASPDDGLLHIYIFLKRLDTEPIFIEFSFVVAWLNARMQENC